MFRKESDDTNALVKRIGQLKKEKLAFNIECRAICVNLYRWMLGVCANGLRLVNLGQMQSAYATNVR